MNIGLILGLLAPRPTQQPPHSDVFITESGDIITTESGDIIITE